MKLIKNYLPFLMLVTVFACSKDDKEETPNLCVENNFGVIKVTFNDSNVKHGLLVTESGTQNGWDKIVPIGQTIDTLHLKPLRTYIINISSLDNDNMAIDSFTINEMIAQCQEIGVTVMF